MIKFAQSKNQWLIFKNISWGIPKVLVLFLGERGGATVCFEYQNEMHKIIYFFPSYGLCYRMNDFIKCVLCPERIAERYTLIYQYLYKCSSYLYLQTMYLQEVYELIKRIPIKRQICICIDSAKSVPEFTMEKPNIKTR